MLSEKCKNLDKKKWPKSEQAKSEQAKSEQTKSEQPNSKQPNSKQPKSEKLKFPQITTSSIQLFLGGVKGWVEMLDFAKLFKMVIWERVQFKA